MLTNAKNRYKLIIVIATLAAFGCVAVFLSGPLISLLGGGTSERSGLAQKLARLFPSVFGNAGDAAEEVPSVPAAGKTIVFTYADPTAKAVLLSGDFNDWQKEAMLRKAAGRWELSRKITDDTDHVYQFVVDGSIKADPGNAITLDQPMRGACSVIVAGVKELVVTVPPLAAPTTAQATAVVQASQPQPAPVESCMLSGSVRDRKGKAVGKAVVKISSEGEEYLRVISNDDGSYQVEGIPPGTYAVKAWKERYAPREVNVSISSSSYTLDFTIDRKK